MPCWRAAQSASWLGALADRREALHGRIAVGQLLGAEREVVRARLGGDPGAVGLGTRDHVDRLGGGHVDDVHVRAGACGEGRERSIARTSQLGGRAARRSA